MTEVLRIVRAATVWIVAGASISMVATTSATAAVYRCTALFMKADSVKNQEALNGYADLDPAHFVPVAIDTGNSVLKLGQTSHRLPATSPVVNSYGQGFHADLPDLGGSLDLIYQQFDEFFVLAIAPIQLAGTCSEQ